MWKIVVGFVVFAALALYVINLGGDKLDMSGEKHEIHVPDAPAGGASAAPAAASQPK
jgi:hypothetical protein